MRIRYLKPDFFKDEHIAELPFWIRLLFAGLWNMADKEGRLERRNKRIKVELYPYDNVDIEKGLNELEKKPFIKTYEVNGNKYIQIVNWHKHQKPHHTEKDSEIPPYPPNMEKGMGNGEGNGEGNGKAAQSECEVKEPLNNVQITVIPEILQGLSLYEQDKKLCKLLPEALPQWQKAYPKVDIQAEIRKAHAWEISNPDKKKVNRMRFLNNWLSRSQDKPEERSNQNVSRISSNLRPDADTSKYRNIEKTK